MWVAVPAVHAPNAESGASHNVGASTSILMPRKCSGRASQGWWHSSSGPESDGFLLPLFALGGVVERGLARNRPTLHKSKPGALEPEQHTGQEQYAAEQVGG